MSRNTQWPLAVSLGLSIVLITSVLPAGAAGGTTVPSTVAQSTTPRATDPAFAGALPESYPWVRLADTLTPAVVNVRTTGEARRTRTSQVPEPFRRFFPQPPQSPQPPEGGGERERPPARRRIRVHHRRRRLHRDEPPRRGRLPVDRGPALRRADLPAEGHRQRRGDRPGPPEDRGDRAPDDPARQLERAEGGGAGDGHREPVRVRSHGDRRHRERHGAVHRSGSVRRLHPDGRRHQPRQLRAAPSSTPGARPSASTRRSGAAPAASRASGSRSRSTWRSRSSASSGPRARSPAGGWACRSSP